MLVELQIRALVVAEGTVPGYSESRVRIVRLRDGQIVDDVAVTATGAASENSTG